MSGIFEKHLQDKPISVLVVEDNQGDQELLKTWIQEDSIRRVDVGVAKDLKTAIARTTSDEYDLILLDLGLPDSLGVETFLKFKAAYQNHPVIIMTGNDDIDMATKCIDLGAQDYLVKGHVQGSITHAIHNAIVRFSLMEALDSSYKSVENMVNNYAYPTYIIGTSSDIIFRNRSARELIGESSIEEKTLTRENWIGDTKEVGNKIFEHHSFLVNWFGATAQMLIVNDITDKRRNEAIISDLARFPDENQNPVIRFGKGGDILYSNSAAKLILDFWGVDKVGRIPEDVINPIKKELEKSHLFSIEARIFKQYYNMTYVSIESRGYINLYATDITEQKRAENEIKLNENRLESLLRISQRKTETTEELLSYTLEEAILLTESTIGYIFLYDEDKQLLQLVNWSTGAFDQCNAAIMSDKLALELTGYWGEAIRQRKTILVNDFELPSPFKKGVPEGPVPVKKFLSIPVFNAQKIVAVVGVANKENDYTESDVRQLKLIMDSAWKIVLRKQTEMDLALSYSKLHASYIKTLEAMSMAIELRDPYTSGHQRRVAALADAIAKQLKVAESTREGVFLASIVHDIGKINVPAEILVRPSTLNSFERSIIQLHSEAGYQILKDIEFPWPIATIVYQHHERMDGSGYPNNLRGEQILPEARIIAVADVVEAMASHRPYRAALGIDKAKAEIKEGAGRLYDKDIVEACLAVLEGTFTFN